MLLGRPKIKPHSCTEVIHPFQIPQAVTPVLRSYIWSHIPQAAQLLAYVWAVTHTPMKQWVLQLISGKLNKLNTISRSEDEGWLPTRTIRIRELGGEEDAVQPVPKTLREGIAWCLLKMLRSDNSSFWQLPLTSHQTHHSIPASYIKQLFNPIKHVIVHIFALNLSDPHTYSEACKDVRWKLFANVTLLWMWMSLHAWAGMRRGGVESCDSEGQTLEPFPGSWQQTDHSRTQEFSDLGEIAYPLSTLLSYSIK